MDRIISAKNDVIFKKLFTDNKEVLQSFISSAIGIPYDDISDIYVKNPELAPNITDGKLSRLDILLTAGGSNINIEMQNAKTTDYKERVLFYWAKMYSEPLKTGQRYSSLDRSISINILDYRMFECEEYCSSFSVMENTRHELYSDKLGLYFFELPKISSKPDSGDMRQLWLQVINADSREELDMLNNTNIPVIQQGIKSIYTLNEDDRIRALAWEREKAERDYYSDMGNAREEGIAEGMARGLARGRAEGVNIGKMEIINKLRAKGMSEAEIAALLG